MILIITYVVALGHFSNIIAGSVDAHFSSTGHAGWLDYLFRFFAPTLIGNLLGRLTLVTVLNYGQVAAEIEGSE